jgi:phosphopantothenoylcysteine decarboxylase/phosphopantothenate--cysteine ligase
MDTKKTVILGVTASVAIYKAGDIIRRLREKGFLVTVVMTPEACRFISPLLFEALSGQKVYSAMFESPESWEIEHISLAQRADIILIAPATAHTINKIAAGLCDDLLSCVVLATKAPVVICPAMNENMFLNAVTQQNIQKLQGLGVRFVSPKTGKLACGTVGTGCLADIETIVESVQSIAG